MDKTPEKSLTQKYKLLIASLYQSSHVKLLATDRTIKLTEPSGQSTLLNHIYAKGYSGKVNIELGNHGSYAIFEIE